MDKYKLSKKELADGVKLTKKYKKRYVAVNKKGRAIALSLLSVFAAGGCSAAGYFGYKAAHSVVEETTKKVTENIELSCDIKNQYIILDDENANEKLIHLNINIKPANQKFDLEFVDLDDNAKNHVSIDSDNVVHIMADCPNCTLSLRAVAADHASSDILNIAIINHNDQTIFNKFEFRLCEDWQTGEQYYTCSIQKKDKYSVTSLVVPSEYKGLKVRLEDYAFSNCYFLRSVFIPKEITSIPQSCFYENVSLESVIFEEDSELEYIDSYAFYYCTSLASINLPSSLIALGAYDDDTRFYDMSVFSGCSNLRKIYIPANVRYISIGNFSSCYMLSEMVVDPSNEYYTSRDGNGKECNGIFGLSKNLISSSDDLYGLISGCYKTTLPETILIDDDVYDNKIINDYAFYDCKLLESISISDSVVAIGNEVFTYSENLKSMYIGKSLIYFGQSNPERQYKSLGDNFKGLTSLEKIDVSSQNPYFCTSNNILYGYIDESLGGEDWAANSNNFDISLLVCPANINNSEITIDNAVNNHTVTAIAAYAFRSCKNVNKIIFNSGSKISTVEDDAFDSSYISSIINFPASITSMNSNVLMCLYTDLVELTFEDKVSEWKDTSDNVLFKGSDDCRTIMDKLYETYGTYMSGTISKVELSPESSSNKYVICANGAVEISSYDLDDKTSFTMDEEITLSGIKYKIISTGDVTSYSEKYIFPNSDEITSLTLSSNLTRIGQASFKYFGAENGCSLVIPNDTNLTEIGEEAFFGSHIKGDLIIPSTVKSLGESAFYGCSLVENVDLSKCTSINSIPDFCFCGDEDDPLSLKSIKLPPNITSIGESAFYQCTNLASIEIPQSVKSIGYSAFYKCSISSVILPNSLTSIANYAFSSCSSLYSIDLSALDHVIDGGEDMFVDCNLSAGSIKVPSDLLDEYKTAEYWSSYADYMVGV